MAETLKSPSDVELSGDKQTTALSGEFNPEGVDIVVEHIAKDLSEANRRKQISREDDDMHHRQLREQTIGELRDRARLSAGILDLVVPLPENKAWLSAIQGEDRERYTPTPS